MKYSLERLDSLVHKTISVSLSNEPPVSQTQFEIWNAEAEREKEKIRIYLMRKSFEIKKEKSLELLIQQYQSAIVRLLDKVFIYQKQTFAVPAKSFYAGMLHHLEDLLSVIEKRYSKYFNLEEKVPEIYLHLSLTELSKEIRALKKTQPESDVEKQLVLVLINSLNLFVKQQQNISYRKLMYVKEVLKYLKDSPLKPRRLSVLRQVQEDRQNTGDNGTDKIPEIVELLVYLNYNCSSIVSFLINLIVETINLIPEQLEKVERLSRFQKEFNQIQLKPGFAFRPRAEPIKNQVTAWIGEEIFYLEQKQRLLSVAPVLNDDSIADEWKLHISASVEVLTILARSAKDSKLILNKEMTVLFRTLAKFCRTSKTENPTANSMLKKSYVADRSNKQKAINILHEMIKFIHRYCAIPFFLYHNFFSDLLDVVWGG